MRNHNPNVDDFLRAYSQSQLSTERTRGYDVATYVPTRLDQKLTPSLLEGRFGLVVLTGNAGDGKTAYIERFERQARQIGAQFERETDNGSVFLLNGVRYETLYDGSQDFQGSTCDAILAGFLQHFEGDRPPSPGITKIIAINEGKLRDFILSKPQYHWLWRQVQRYLDDESFAPHESLAFVNLNLRSVVSDTIEGKDSIYDRLLARFLQPGFWEPCLPANCDYADRCPVAYNIRMLTDPAAGNRVRSRIEFLLQATHFRGKLHITMRDLRSALSFILVGRLPCNAIQHAVDEGADLSGSFYYNAVFSTAERDRLIRLISELDVAAVTNPKLDSFVHFREPNVGNYGGVLDAVDWEVAADLSHLRRLFAIRPEGTEAVGNRPARDAEAYHAAMRRKLFFEAREPWLGEMGVSSWLDMTPYRRFRDYASVIRTGADPGHQVRDLLTLAISKSERIYNEVLGQEHLCVRTAASRSSDMKAFYSFPASDFRVSVSNADGRGEFIEYCPSDIQYEHVAGLTSDGRAAVSLRIPLDLFEMLCRIRDGYMPTAREIRTMFLNLHMFKRRLLSHPPRAVILTEDDSNLYRLDRDASNNLVLTQWGG